MSKGIGHSKKLKVLSMLSCCHNKIEGVIESLITDLESKEQQILALEEKIITLKHRCEVLENEKELILLSKPSQIFDQPEYIVNTYLEKLSLAEFSSYEIVDFYKGALTSKHKETITKIVEYITYLDIDTVFTEEAIISFLKLVEQTITNQNCDESFYYAVLELFEILRETQYRSLAKSLLENLPYKIAEHTLHSKEINKVEIIRLLFSYGIKIPLIQNFKTLINSTSFEDYLDEDIITLLWIGFCVGMDDFLFPRLPLKKIDKLMNQNVEMILYKVFYDFVNKEIISEKELNESLTNFKESGRIFTKVEKEIILNELSKRITDFKQPLKDLRPQPKEAKCFDKLVQIKRNMEYCPKCSSLLRVNKIKVAAYDLRDSKIEDINVVAAVCNKCSIAYSNADEIRKIHKTIKKKKLKIKIELCQISYRKSKTPEKKKSLKLKVTAIGNTTLVKYKGITDKIPKPTVIGRCLGCLKLASGSCNGPAVALGSYDRPNYFCSNFTPKRKIDFS